MEEKQNSFKDKATEQNNQLRIALISISVGLCAFFAKELNSTVTFSQYPHLYYTVILSLLACISGLSAWKSSAQIFYAMNEDKKRSGDENKKGPWHSLKRFFDTALSSLLALAVFTALMPLVFERG